MFEVSERENQYLNSVLVRDMDYEELKQSAVQDKDDQRRIEDYLTCDHVFDSLADFEHTAIDCNISSSTVWCVLCGVQVDFVQKDGLPLRADVVIDSVIKTSFYVWDERTRDKIQDKLINVDEHQLTYVKFQHEEEISGIIDP